MNALTRAAISPAIRDPSVGLMHNLTTAYGPGCRGSVQARVRALRRDHKPFLAALGPPSLSLAAGQDGEDDHRPVSADLPPAGIGLRLHEEGFMQQVGEYETGAEARTDRCAWPLDPAARDGHPRVIQVLIGELQVGRVQPEDIGVGRVVEEEAGEVVPIRLGDEGSRPAGGPPAP